MSTGLLGVVQRISQDVRLLRRQIPSKPEWGTVTGVAPLRVRPDSAEFPLLDAPENLAGPLLVGDRVMVQLVGRQLIVWGKAGGPGGAPLYFPSLAVATAANLPVGTQIWVTSDNRGYVRKSVGWAVNSHTIVTGTITVPITAAGTVGSVIVPLPAGTFAGTPTVILTPMTNNPSTVTGIAIETRTATSFKVVATRTGAWDLSVQWVAVGA